VNCASTESESLSGTPLSGSGCAKSLSEVSAGARYRAQRISAPPKGARELPALRAVRVSERHTRQNMRSKRPMTGYVYLADSPARKVVAMGR
jgi:hypothetical protein